jgi:RNA polymerase sigma-70 factor (ECF subfamily)
MHIDYNISDSALWNLLTEGDIKAGGALYEKYYELLFNYGIKFCSDEEFVRDCIQELFVKLYNRSRKVQVEHVRAYLLKSLRNIIFDSYASKSRTVSFGQLTFNIFKIETIDIPCGEMTDEMLKIRDQLSAARATLTEKQAHIIYLRFVRGLSYKEVAAVLDMNVQSAMNLVNRAMIKLRNFMKKP